MDSDKIHKIENSSLDVRCSASCTRAGVTALILATLAIWILVSFSDMKPYIALSEYVGLRLSLIDNIDMLEQDQCWKNLVSKSSKESPEKWPFIKLLDYVCNEPDLKSDSKKFRAKIVFNVTPQKDRNRKQDLKNDNNREKDLKNDNNKSSSKEDHMALSSPTNFALLQGLTGVTAISDILVKLFDNSFLSVARSYTYKFARSIYKWIMFREKLIAKEGRSSIKGIWGALEIENGQIKFDKIITKEARKNICENLTFEQIKLLAKYELPNLTEIENLGKKFSNISISSLGIPMSFYFASIFGEFALCFVLIYFWLYQREAKYSETYPAAGTLFGVFGRGHLNHMIFLILIAFPPTAAVLLAFFTYPLTRLNIIPATIITIVSILIAYETRNLLKKNMDEK